MKKNIKVSVLFGILCLLFITSTAYAASTSATVAIGKNDYSKSSSSVGVSTRAKYSATSYASSTKNMTMKAYACWTGWPYTCESSTTIAPSGSYSYTETQSRNSNFYIELVGYNACSGYGSVSVN